MVAAPAVPPPYADGQERAAHAHTVAEFVAAVEQAQRAYRLGWVWTLTISTGTCSGAESDKAVKTCWARLRRDLWRRYGRFHYVGLPEVTQRGFTHLHIYVSIDVPEDELRALWTAATNGSWVVKVQRVRPGRLAQYLAKQLNGRESVPGRPNGFWLSSQSIHLFALIPARASARTRSVLDWPHTVKPPEPNHGVSVTTASAATETPWQACMQESTNPDQSVPRGGAAGPRPASGAVPSTPSPGSGDTMTHAPPLALAGAAPIKRDDATIVVTHTAAKCKDTIVPGGVARRYGIDPETMRRWGLDPDSDFQVRALLALRGRAAEAGPPRAPPWSCPGAIANTAALAGGVPAEAGGREAAKRGPPGG